MHRRFPLAANERQQLEVQLSRFASVALHRLTPCEARAQLAERRARRIVKKNPEIRIVDETLPTARAVRVRRYEPLQEKLEGTIVYCHGGGWVMGQPEDFDATCATLALRSSLPVVSVDYRLAPEHPYPAALQDVTETLRTLASAAAEGRPASLYLLGESAGGNLALAAAMIARDEEIERIRGLILFFPVTVYTATVAAVDVVQDSPFLCAADLPWCWRHYLPEAWMQTEPLASPGNLGALHDLPPTLLAHGTRDPISPSVSALAHRLADSGVPVEEWIYESLPHAFTALSEMSAVPHVLSATAQWVRSVSST